MVEISLGEPWVKIIQNRHLKAFRKLYLEHCLKYFFVSSSLLIVFYQIDTLFKLA